MVLLSKNADSRKRGVLETAVRAAVLLLLACAPAFAPGCGGGSAHVEYTYISGTVSLPTGMSLGRAASRNADALGEELSAGYEVSLKSGDVFTTVWDEMPVLDAHNVLPVRTDSSGHYSIPLPAEFEPSPFLVVSVAVGDEEMRSIASSTETDINPATELVTQKIIESNVNPASFSNTEIKAMEDKVGRDMAGLDFSEATSISQAITLMDKGDLATDLDAMVSASAKGDYLTACGNGITESGETCDDGNTVTESCTYGQASCTVCNSSCQSVAGAASYCGDSTVDTSEQCDDGNSTTETSCPYGDTSACTICNATCQNATASTLSYCGDGTTDTSNSEQCDDSGATLNTNCEYGVQSCVVCTSSCKQEDNAQYCGDGKVQSQYETCDDGNTTEGDGCSMDCQTESAMGAM